MDQRVTPDRLRKTTGMRYHLHAMRGARRIHARRAILPKIVMPDTPTIRNALFRAILKTAIIYELRRLRRHFRRFFGCEI